LLSDIEFVGFWLTATGALLVNLSLVIGEFARTGWLPYPPLSELTYSPGVGSITTFGRLKSPVWNLLAGINLITTVLKLHAPHDLYADDDVLLDDACLQLANRRGVPILTATLTMLMLDRYSVSTFSPTKPAAI